MREQADRAWDPFIRRGLLCVCEPVVAETLLTSDSKRYEATEAFIDRTYLPVVIPDGRYLESGGRHPPRTRAPQRPRWSVGADLVVAATAIRLKRTVLHEDGDFETVSRFVPEPQEHRLSAGPR